jgi:hypothetical protein
MDIRVVGRGTRRRRLTEASDLRSLGAHRMPSATSDHEDYVRFCERRSARISTTNDRDRAYFGVQARGTRSDRLYRRPFRLIMGNRVP